MADEDLRKSITIDIPDDDTPVIKKVESQKPETVEKVERQRAQPSAEDGIEDLAKQLKASKDREAEARRRAVEKDEEARVAKEEVVKSRGAAVDSQLIATASAIEAKTSERERLRGSYKAAAETGDYDGMSKIQDQMADLAADLNSLKRDKAGIEERIAAHDAARQSGATEGTVRPQQRGTGDPVQDFIENMPAGKSKAWLQANRDRVDAKTLRRLGHTHDEAMMDGIEVDSPEYFDKLEERLDALTGGKQVDVEAEPTPRRSAAKEAANYSAPASREAPTYSSRNRPNRVTLTPAQQEAAEISGISYEEYAKHLLAIQREPKDDNRGRG